MVRIIVTEHFFSPPHVDSIFMLFTVSRHGLAVLASSLSKSYCNCVDLPDAGWGAIAGVSEHDSVRAGNFLTS